MQKKVLLVSSSGGHWVQLNRLLPAFDGTEKYFATTQKRYKDSFAAGKFFIIPDVSRWNKLSVLWSTAVLLRILILIKPDIVVSTGAAPGFFAILFGKIMGAKTIWVDSIANVDNLSLSGKLVGKYADLWLTQWEHLSTPNGPFFKGKIL